MVIHNKINNAVLSTSLITVLLAIAGCSSTSSNVKHENNSSGATAGLSLRGAIRAVEDPALRSCLAKAAKAQKVKRKSKLTRVDCSGNGQGYKSARDIMDDPGIKSLKGIEYFRGISTLKLNYNAGIKDISPIANLPLIDLSLKHTQIDDNALNVIAKLTNLRKLDLEYSFNISSSELINQSLSGLTKLRHLNMRAMGSKLASTKQFPQLADGIVNNVSFLANMPNIHTVNLSGNKITTGLTAFYNTPQIANLTMVNVVYTKGVDLSPYKALDNNSLRNIFIQSNNSAPCDQLLDIVQHYAPSTKSAKSPNNYTDGYFYLENKNPKSFIKISNSCVPY